MTATPDSRLSVYIAGAVVAAIVLAFAAPAFAMRFAIGGEIFLNLHTMMVVPLVVASVMSGIIGLGDVRKLGRPGGLAITYYPALFLKLDIRDRQGVAGRRTGFRHRHMGAARGLRGEPWGDGRAR